MPCFSRLVFASVALFFYETWQIVKMFSHMCFVSQQFQQVIFICVDGLYLHSTNSEGMCSQD